MPVASGAVGCALAVEVGQEADAVGAGFAFECEGGEAVVVDAEDSCGEVEDFCAVEGAG